MVAYITTLEEFNTIINSNELTLIDFTATWCGPCRSISPYVDILSNKYPSLNVYKVDVDNASSIAQECGIQCMPTFQVYKSGECIGEMKGASKTNLDLLITKLMNKFTQTQNMIN